MFAPHDWHHDECTLKLVPVWWCEDKDVVTIDTIRSWCIANDVTCKWETSTKVPLSTKYDMIDFCFKTSEGFMLFRLTFSELVVRDDPI